MYISKNDVNSNRFDIKGIVDSGYTKDNHQVTGIKGYQGRLDNIIGWVLENIFHKAVSVRDKEGTKYYLNCNSLVKWADRIRGKGYEVDPNLSTNILNSKFVQNALESIKSKKESDNKRPSEDKDPEQRGSKDEPVGPAQREQPNEPSKTPQTSQDTRPTPDQNKQDSENPSLKNEGRNLEEPTTNKQSAPLNAKEEQPSTPQTPSDILNPERLTADNLDHLTVENIGYFDFSKVILSKDSVYQLLAIDGIAKLQQISPKNLNLLAPYFSDNHWEWLSVDTLQEIDFSKVTLSDDLIEKVIFPFNGKAEERLPEISKENIALIHPYFSLGHWNLLSDGQIKDFDFSKFQGKQHILEAFFSTVGITSSKAQERIPLLSAESLYGLASFLQDKNLWGYVSDLQIQRLDFSKVILENDKKQTMFDTLFYPIADNAGQTSKAEDRIPMLLKNQIHDLAPFFDSRNLESLIKDKLMKDQIKNMWSFVDEDQVIYLKFDLLKERLTAEQYKKMLSTLFDDKNLQNAKDRYSSLKEKQALFIKKDLNPEITTS